MGEQIRIVIDDSALIKLMNELPDTPVSAIVADGVEYGVYVELGVENAFGKGIKIPARPCAAPAVETVRSGYEQAFKGIDNITHAERVVVKAARNVERLWKQNIVEEDAIDTGAYLNSVHIVSGKQYVAEFESMR